MSAGTLSRPETPPSYGGTGVSWDVKQARNTTVLQGRGGGGGGLVSAGEMWCSGEQPRSTNILPGVGGGGGGGTSVNSSGVHVCFPGEHA